MASPQISLIVAAGGISTRFSSRTKKQFTELNGIPVLAHCLKTFHSTTRIDNIVLVTTEDELQNTESLIKKSNFHKVRKIIKGGKERKHSIYNGFLNLPQGTDIVVIHDAARPFVTKELVNTVIENSLDHGACIPAISVTDTVKSINSNNTIENTLPREMLCRAQTPQAFEYNVLKKTYDSINLENTTATDESQLVEQCGFEVKIVDGSETNIKITTPFDLKYAEFLIKERLV